MKKIIFLILFIVVLFISLSFAYKLNSLELEKGKNKISFNVTNMYARDIVKAYPKSIESITYKQGNESYGFVNVFGGIGKNFALEENKSYEINSKKNITIYLK